MVIEMTSFRLKRILYKLSCFIYTRTSIVFYINQERLITECNANVLFVTSLIDLNNVSYRSPQTEAAVKSELQAGSKLYVMVDDDGYLMHFSCLSLSDKKVGEISSVICISPPCVYVYHCFTEINSRGKGCYYQVLSKVSLEYGKGKCYITCLESNKASSSVILKAGFERLFSVKFLRVFGLKFFTPSNVELFNKLVRR
jgi:hypothetical protein